MANNVFANGREISCKAGSGKSIAAFPDVCMTPPENPATPPGVPVPYPNTGMTSDTTSGSRTVKVTGKEAMLKNKSYFKKSSGDEAGSAAKKGVVTSVNRGKVYFTMWSMDVKIEGENAVRHLDMTTHNHGSGPNSVPWPFNDSAAMGSGGACNQAPPKDYADQVDANCSSPPHECHTAACCSARKCMMVPGSLKPNHCCSRSGKQMTPHHAIPVMDHYGETGARKLQAGPIKQSKKIHGCKSYDENNAPAICVSGHDHGAREASGRLKQHGRIGRAYTYMRDSLEGDTYKYEDVAAPTADTIGHHVGCDPDCIKAQMDQYHSKSSKGNLRKSKNPREEGDKHYEEAIPDDSHYFD